MPGWYRFSLMGNTAEYGEDRLPRGMRLLTVVFLCFTCAASYADEIFSLDRARPDMRHYPVTELRMVREPGNFHFMQTNDGAYILTDMWWREVKTGERRYAAGQPGMSPGIPLPPGPVNPNPGMPQAGQRRKVFVEIVGGKGYEFFGKEKVKDTSFTLIEDFPRNVQIRYGRSRGTLVAVYDGYHVDLSLEQAAKVIPGYNGVIQDLGDGQGLQDVEVVVYWEEDDRGEVLFYKENAVREGIDTDAWGVNLKSKVQTRKGVSQPSAEPSASVGPEPSAPPSASPQAPSAQSVPLENAKENKP